MYTYPIPMRYHSGCTSGKTILSKRRADLMSAFGTFWRKAKRQKEAWVEQPVFFFGGVDTDDGIEKRPSIEGVFYIFR